MFLIIGFGLLVGLGLWIYMDLPLEKAFRDGMFQVVSVMTTTGFTTNDYMQWHPIGLWLILLLVMLIGGSAGSTSGGIKVVRIHILLRNTASNLRDCCFQVPCYP